MCESGPELIYYIYLPVSIVIALLGVFVLWVGKNKLSNRLFFLLTTTISVWLLAVMMNWVSTDPYFVALYYKLALVGVVVPAIFVFFCYAFTGEVRIPKAKILLVVLPLFPFLLFSGTSLNVKSIDTTSPQCDAVTGLLYWLIPFLFLYYTVWSISILYKKYKKEGSVVRHQVILILSSFIFLFVWALVVNVLLQILGYEQYSLYSPIGVLVVILLMTYAIVKYQFLNTKLIFAQALVTGLIVLIGSQFFFIKSTVNYFLVGMTFLLSTIGGYFLVKSVKKEVRQREEIERLAKGLEIANERLKQLDKMKSEFVSIASHQLRSPLTSIRGYASMLAEGSYGKMPQKQQEVAERIEESAKYMALSVEDYLNVSRIEAGNMKYEYSDFNLKELVEKITDELRPVALKKGLVMVFRSHCDGSCRVHADIGKTRQIILNIIDNSMKYTRKGTVTVVAHDDPKAKKMLLTIQDTGVGMSSATLEEVFEKFVRAKNANSVNVTGTGLGLYVAKKMITDMGGHVWAESEGEGKGSTFHIEFPLLPGDTPKR
jgi:signal transduction histidine kinase